MAISFVIFSYFNCLFRGDYQTKRPGNSTHFVYRHRAVTETLRFVTAFFGSHSAPAPHLFRAGHGTPRVSPITAPATGFQAKTAQKQGQTLSHRVMQVAEFTQPTRQITHQGIFHPHMTHHGFLFDFR
jgi:hypothetical protein